MRGRTSIAACSMPAAGTDVANSRFSAWPGAVTDGIRSIFDELPNKDIWRQTSKRKTCSFLCSLLSRRGTRQGGRQRVPTSPFRPWRCSRRAAIQPGRRLSQPCVEVTGRGPVSSNAGRDACATGSRAGQGVAPLGPDPPTRAEAPGHGVEQKKAGPANGSGWENGVETLTRFAAGGGFRAC